MTQPASSESFNIEDVVQDLSIQVGQLTAQVAMRDSVIRGLRAKLEEAHLPDAPAE